MVFLGLLVYFNSIKVRLEQTKENCSIIRSLFQFHKGAIRTRKGETRTPISVVFQFHKGAIRTDIVVSKRSGIENFNSIKVRLEPLHSVMLIILPRHFNSIKVRLERVTGQDVDAIYNISIP